MRKKLKKKKELQKLKKKNQILAEKNVKIEQQETSSI